MVVEPRVKDFICTTAHPVGCAQNVKNQIEYVKSKGAVKSDNAPKKVLVIGASTGYGLASRIAVAFGYGADTLGVMFEKESNGRRTATAASTTTEHLRRRLTRPDSMQSPSMATRSQSRLRSRLSRPSRQTWARLI